MTDDKNATRRLVNILNRPELQAKSLSMALDYQRKNHRHPKEAPEERQAIDKKYWEKTELLEKIEDALTPPLEMDLLRDKLNQYLQKYPPIVDVTPRKVFKVDWGTALIKELIVAIPSLCPNSIKRCAGVGCKELFTGGGKKQKHCSATCRKKNYHRPYDPTRKEYYRLYQNLVVRGGLPLKVFNKEWGKVKQAQPDGGEDGKAKWKR